MSSLLCRESSTPDQLVFMSCLLLGIPVLLAHL